jgi:hypothetical protein
MNLSTLALLVIGVVTVGIGYRCVSSLSDKCPDPVLRNSLLFLTVLGAVLASASATALFACKEKCGSTNLEIVTGILLTIIITSSIAYSKYDCDSERKKDLSYLLGISILGISMCGALLFIKHTEKPSASGSFGMYRNMSNAELKRVNRLASVLNNADPAPGSQRAKVAEERRALEKRYEQERVARRGYSIDDAPSVFGEILLANAPPPPSHPVRKRG